MRFGEEAEIALVSALLFFILADTDFLAVVVGAQQVHAPWYLPAGEAGGLGWSCG